MAKHNEKTLRMNVRYETAADIGTFSIHAMADSLEKLLRKAIKHRLFTKKALLHAVKRIAK